MSGYHYRTKGDASDWPSQWSIKRAGAAEGLHAVTKRNEGYSWAPLALIPGQSESGCGQ